MKNSGMGKQIDMQKCSACGTYFAHYFIKEGKCKDCLSSAPKQEIAEQKPADTNQSGETNNV